MIQNFLDTIHSFTTTQLLLALLAGFLWLFRFFYLLLFPLRIILHRNSKLARNTKVPLSLLLVVRNEEENCKKTVPRLANLENSDFEIIVVDDFSQDSTLSVLGLLKQRYNKLKISSLSQETRYSEKMAQNIAIKSASHNWILFYPINAGNPNLAWLDEMRKPTTDQVCVKLAHISIPASNNWLNKLYRIENFFQTIKSASYSLNGISFIYNEENVAFKKAEYFKLGGFGTKVQEPYANLELVINRFIRKKNLELILNKRSTIQKDILVDRADFKDLVRKSIRIEQHLSNWKQFMLLVDRWTQVLYVIAIGLVLVVISNIWPIVLTLAGVNVLVFMVIIKILQKRLNENKLFITSLVYSLIMPFYKPLLRWNFNRKNKKHKWRNKF